LKQTLFVDIENIYNLYGESMYRYLSIKLGSEVDAEDVLQSVLCRLVRYSLRMRLARYPRAFVFCVARNEAIRFLKNKICAANQVRTFDEISQAIGKTVAGPDEESTRLISKALALLPAEQREVIILKVFEGLTFREIAGACGESQNTVASRYRYGLQKLRAVVEK
jgi:RNA polymerase sigma-70 factor (ECF subfamily)